MLLTRIQVRGFRNLHPLDWSPSPGLNLIAGDNGQGKTNLLEAIHMGALGRSFRVIKDEEALAWEGSSAEAGAEAGGLVIEAETRRRWGTHRTRVTIGRGWKRVHQDDRLLGRLADLLESALVVSFTPADVDLFRESPGRRRRFLDLTLCQLSAPYLRALTRYQRALKQANALLKMRGASAHERRAQAAGFYATMAESGAALITERAARVTTLDEVCGGLFQELGGAAELELKYLPNPRKLETEQSAAGAAEALLARFEEAHEESERLGAVAAGPHRDDLRARRDGRDLGRFGSQGQNRLAALAVKLGSARLLELVREEPPILLLDDFGSELDPPRRRATLESLRGRIQVFVTATREADLGADGLFDDVRELKRGNWACE